MPSARQETYTAKQGFAVTPSDTVDLSAPCRALYVGTGGDVTVIQLDNSTAVTFKNVASGAILPIQVARVKATATTATDIVALY